MKVAISVAEILEAVPGLTYRTFSFYKEQGLLPLALRTGPRGGSHPRWVLDLTQWITDLRSNDVPIGVIRDFVPLWRFVALAEGRAELPEGRAWWLPSFLTSLEIPAPHEFPGAGTRWFEVWDLSLTKA